MEVIFRSLTKLWHFYDWELIQTLSETSILIYPNECGPTMHILSTIALKNDNMLPQNWIHGTNDYVRK